MPIVIEQIYEAKVRELLPQHLGYGNLISQADLDQGDTAQRVGTFFTLVEMTGYTDTSNHASFRSAYAQLGAGYGLYRRSPNPSFWGYDPNNLSRDQLSVLKIGLANDGIANVATHFRLLDVAFRQAMRLGFHQNTQPGADTSGWKVPDIMTPGELSVYARGLLGSFSVVPNFFLDMFLFVDLYTRKDDNWDSDNMLALQLLFANHKYPTVWSKLAMKMFLKTNFMSRLYNYHKDTGNNGCEPLYWLFKLAFLKLHNYTSEE